jgi:SAM-dependent methyltransferase
MDRANHWNRVFTTKTEDQVSWFETVPSVSLRLLEAAGLTRDSRVVDIGGGDSHLVDHLVDRGVRHVAVLDVSSAALDRAHRRLRNAAAVPTWIEADVTGEWTLEPVDIWHDRAVFHFLTLAEDRDAYRTRLLRTLKPDGTAIIATFAADGPEHCSGLPVVRYSPESLVEALGPGFELIEAVPYVHTTPWGSTQSFQYSRMRRMHALPGRSAS